jgi:hypothetical protein
MLKAYLDNREHNRSFALLHVDPDLLERYSTAASGYVEKPEWATDQFAKLSEDIAHGRSGQSLLFKSVVDISLAKTAYDRYFLAETRQKHFNGELSYIEPFDQGENTTDILAELEQQEARHAAAIEARPYLWPGEVNDHLGLVNCYTYGASGTFSSWETEKTLSIFLEMLATPQPLNSLKISFFDLPIVKTFCQNILEADRAIYQIVQPEMYYGNWFLTEYLKHNRS